MRNPIKRQPLKQRPPRKYKTDKGEINMTNTELLRRKIMFRKFFVAAVAVNVALACFAAIVQKNPTVLLSNVAGLLWCV